MSDNVLRHRVIEALESLPLIGASRIAIAVQDGRVVLTGRIASPTHKMLLNFTVPTLEGVRELALDLVAESLGESVDGDQCGRPDVASDMVRRNDQRDADWSRLDIEHFNWLTRGGK